MKINFPVLISALCLSFNVYSQNPISLNPTPLKIEKSADYTKSQTYYQIDLSAAYCKFEIMVNDVMVFSLNLDAQTSMMLPLNSGILNSGKQVLTVYVRPLEGQKTLSPNADFKYDIKVFDVANSFELKKEIPGTGFDKLSAIEKQKMQNFAAFNSEFEADVPYSITAYQSSTDLRAAQGLKEQLLAAYKQLSDLIAKRNTEELKKLVASRESLAGTTMYLTEQESEERMQGLLESIKSGYQLQPIPAATELKIFGKGKLATLLRTDGKPLLILKNEKEGEELALEFSFYIPEGKTAPEII